MQAYGHDVLISRASSNRRFANLSLITAAGDAEQAEPAAQSRQRRFLDEVWSWLFLPKAYTRLRRQNAI
jgi:hypothetical protein